MKIQINTSVDDLTTSFKCENGIAHYSEEDIEMAIFDELNGQNRVSIIKLLRRALRMKKQGANSIS